MPATHTRRDAAFAARPRLAALREALISTAKMLRRAVWNEPDVFFFDPKRQAELEAARTAPADSFAELTAVISAELLELVATVEVRRIARATDGLSAAASALAPRCRAARDLTELLAVPDDEVFLALVPDNRTGVRLHLRGAATVADLHRILAPAFGLASTPFQLFLPAALRTDGTLPGGFAGCEHWLWPTQPLAAAPRVGGERIVLVGGAVVQPVLDTEPRFPGLKVEVEPVQVLNAFQTAEALARLCGAPVPIQKPLPVPVPARAA
jgi:hypothetical protein